MSKHGAFDLPSRVGGRDEVSLLWTNVMVDHDFLLLLDYNHTAPDPESSIRSNYYSELLLLYTSYPTSKRTERMLEFSLAELLRA